MAYTGHTFTFESGSGHDTSDYYGLRIASTPTIETGSPEYEDYDIPGRQFKMTVPSGSWEASKRSYNVSFPGEDTGLIYPAWQNAIDNQSTWTINDNINAIKYWLYRNTNWVKLRDTYENNVFHLARVSGGLSFSQIPKEVAQATITFEVDPRTFYDSGSSMVSLGSTIFNPGLTAQPTIRFYCSGSGGMTIVTTIDGVTKNYTISVSTPTGKTLEIDSETMSIYDISGSGIRSNGSAYIARMTEFPMLGPGTSTIINNGLSTLRITPHWWHP